MSGTDRRKFLAVAGVGAAAGAAGVVGMAGPAMARTTGGGAAVTDSVVVLVEDPRGDTLTLMVGEREVEVRDRDLVVRILNAAAGEN